jgi:hypothetical protein
MTRPTQRSMPRPDLTCWLYASVCALPQSWAPRAVEDIVATSLARNADSAVTGALLFTGTHFVQFLEGPAQGMAAIRHSIAADTRHHTIRTILEGPRAERRFADWSLAYTGPSLFVADRVQGLLDGQGDDVEGMLNLLREFTLPA